VPLKFLTSVPSGVRPDMVPRGPGGLDATRYDIQANIAGPDVANLGKLSPGLCGSMLRPLWADPFELAFHKETNLLPVYNLLTGKYDIPFKGTPNKDAKGPGSDIGQHGADSIPPPEASGPSLFPALQERLGLKLESAKGLIEVPVNDHAQPHSAN